MPSNPSPEYFAGLSNSNTVQRKHLADQFMLTLGSGGGVFRTMGLPLHSTTHMEIPQ
jgi:hypothetical protein